MAQLSMLDGTPPSRHVRPHRFPGYSEHIDVRELVVMLQRASVAGLGGVRVLLGEFTDLFCGTMELF